MVKTLVACGDYPEDEGETTAQMQPKKNKKYRSTSIGAGETLVLMLPTGQKVVVNANRSGLYTDVEICEPDYSIIHSHTVYAKTENANN